MTFIIFTYWFLMMLLITANVVIYFFHIVPYVRKNGYKSWTDWTNLGYFEKTDKYKAICESEGKSLYWYDLQNKIFMATYYGMIGWMVLIFGSALLGLI